MTGTGARRFALLATTFLISFNVNLVDAVAREKPKQKQQAAEALDANAQAVQLDTINVESENTGQTGYVATRTSTATKIDTPLRDVPQSVSVVTEELIKDTSAQSMADVVRYVPGVSPQQGEGNRDQISIRGQSTTADF
ncbi:MAG TPA: TonB-dependent receptor plug domain-containing protein, partial [Xanthobacteraceae bacterium]